MSRKLTAILLAMVVLAGAMCLKTVVTAHNNNDVVMMANGSAPFPPAARNGSAPFPPAARNGSAPFPPRNGSAPFPPEAVSSK